MTTKTIHRAGTPGGVAQLITNRLFALADHQDRPIHVALSGGSTPLTLFGYWQKVSAELIRRRIHFWWVDERMVPVDSPESNYGNAHRAYFGPAGYPAELLHPIPYSDGQTTADAAHRYDYLLEESRTHEGRPYALDLVILGIGDDGHTSSLFPGQKLYEVESRYLASVNPYNGVDRVALSYQGILEAPLVLFHVMGATKRPMLERVLRPASPEEARLPAAYVIAHACRTELYTDISLEL